MSENDFYEVLSMFENETYQNWRKVHARALGDLFENAFVENDEAQMCLTAKWGELNFTLRVKRAKLHCERSEQLHFCKAKTSLIRWDKCEF